MAQIGECLACLIQCQPEVNAGVIEALQHEVLVGAGRADSRFDQRGNSHATLHYGIVHLSCDPGPLRQAEIVVLACLPLLIEKNTGDAGARSQDRQRIEPGGLIEVRLDYQRDTGL